MLRRVVPPEASALLRYWLRKILVPAARRRWPHRAGAWLRTAGRGDACPGRPGTLPALAASPWLAGVRVPPPPLGGLPRPGPAGGGEAGAASPCPKLRE